MTVPIVKAWTSRWLRMPAHNEAESIAATVCALRAQTRIPDEIIVICDNCTDATAEIASDHGATVWTTSGNTHKKAGAG